VCGAVCDPNNGTWTCTGSCPVDAGEPFDCGTQDCTPDEVCTATEPGIAFPDGGVPTPYYQCIPAPAGCAMNDSCACVFPALKQGGYACVPISCAEPFGHPVVTCMGM
jgi:hypothetical protein